MIRSSKFIFKYQTQSKSDELIKIYTEYVRIVNEYIKLFFYDKNQPFNTATVHSVNSFLSARYKSNACKQALENVRSLWKKKKTKRPEFKGEIVLDSKFIKINTDNPNHYDLWFRMSTSNKGKLINIPCKRHKQFNKWLSIGNLKQSIAIKYLNNKLRFRLFIDIPNKPLKTKGKIVGCDVGYNKMLVTSDNKIYGSKLKNIANKIHGRIANSNRYNKSLEERNNYINYELNKIDFSKIRVLVIENIKNLKKNRYVGKLHYWSYKLIFDKLERLCEENCVRLIKVNPAYTSQECSTCGFIDKANRKRELFTCKSCGFICDADYNASLNIKSRSLESLAFT